MSGTETWLQNSMDISLATLQGKEAEVRSQVLELCRDFFAAIEADRLQLERELEQASHQAMLDKEAARENEEDQFHRKLCKSDRMRMVIKNKEEGTELFLGGYYHSAATKFNKSLIHCGQSLCHCCLRVLFLLCRVVVVVC